MSQIDENLTRVYTINLGRAWITPQHKRTDRVINMIKEFAKKHMKSEEIKIDQDLNRQIWKRGKTNPPRKVRVKMVKDDNGIVIVSSYEEAIKTAATAGSESASLDDHEKEDLNSSNSANASAD
jgi:large subunit ribosomal protein L31e